MNRNPLALIVALGLAIYGVYVASYLPGLLIGASSALLLVGFFLQASAAIAAAIGISIGSAWAPVAAIVLGAAIAFTSLAEGFILGIVSYDRAIGVGLVGILVTIAIAVYFRRPRGLNVM